MRLPIGSVVLAALFVGPGALAAAEIPIAGKTLTVKPAKLLRFVARAKPDPVAVPEPGSSQDPTLGGAILRVVDYAGNGAGGVAFGLDASGWKALGKPAGSRGYRYRGKLDAMDPDPKGTCRSVVLTARRIEAVCKGEAVAVAPPFGGDAGVTLELPGDGSGVRYCARFGSAGEVNVAERLKRRNAATPASCNVAVRITPTETTGRLDERYIGYSFDWAKVDDGLWPTYTHRLEDAKLRTLVSHLAPSRLRIGGTDSSGAYFCEDAACTLPETFAGAYVDVDKVAPTFTPLDVSRLAEFAAAVDSTIMFSVNVGPGPRDPSTGAWTGDNIRALMQHVAGLRDGGRFAEWEAGNEVNIMAAEFRMPVPFTPALYAADLAALRQMVADEVPGGRVAGPASFFFPSVAAGDFNFTRNLLQLDPNAVDLVTWHLYATQSPRCLPVASPFPASKENLFNETAIAMNRGFARYVETYAGGLPIVNSESASVQCGGQFGISDTMLDALWFADWLGILFAEGTQALVRQTLIGREYAMLDMRTLDPHPTFLVYVMFRRAVADWQLATTADRARIKAHAYCAPGGGGEVTAVLSNPSDAPVDVELAISGSPLAGAGQWSVDAAGLLAPTSGAINGLPVAADGTVPDPPGEPVADTGDRAFAQVGANAVAFVVLTPSTPMAPCARP